MITLDFEGSSPIVVTDPDTVCFSLLSISTIISRPCTALTI